MSSFFLSSDVNCGNIGQTVCRTGERQGGGEMKYFKITYANGKTKTVEAANSLAVIKKLDLATREHIETRVTELTGEQEAIARSNFDINQ